ncbi:hypothetical protein KI387_005164, partial [Taxus chinensis]
SQAPLSNCYGPQSDCGYGRTWYGLYTMEQLLVLNKLSTSGMLVWLVNGFIWRMELAEGEPSGFIRISKAGNNRRAHQVHGHFR